MTKSITIDNTSYDVHSGTEGLYIFYGDSTVYLKDLKKLGVSHEVEASLSDRLRDAIAEFSIATTEETLQGTRSREFVTNKARARVYALLKEVGELEK